MCWCNDQLLNSKKFETRNDSTVAARFLYLSAKSNYFGFLKASSHRKRLKKLNLNDDIKYCLTPNQTSVIPLERITILKYLPNFMYILLSPTKTMIQPSVEFNNFENSKPYFKSKAELINSALKKLK